MKMIKKLISVSVILTTALAMGVLVDVGSANAAHNSVTFSEATTIDIEDLVISANSQVEQIAVGTTTVTINMQVGSTITFTSASGKVMALDHTSAGTNSCAAGGGSSLTVSYDASHPIVVLDLTGATCATYALTEANVAANPLTADTASAYTITFKTSHELAADSKIKLVFGTGFTILDSTDEDLVDTDGGVGFTLLDGDFSSVASSKTITLIIPFGTTLAAGSVIDIVLDNTLVKNPTPASADVAVSGVDISTTDSGDTVIDALADQTAFNRVIDLVPGWNIFAPSQALESSTASTVLTPIGASNYDDILTLTLDATTDTMTWQTATTIKPLYGYAIHITGSSTVNLPLDFAKEIPGNSTFTRNLVNKGWQLIGYTGTSASLEAQVSCLDGLTVSGNEEFSSIVDLTGTTAGSTAPTSHAFGASTTSELFGGSGMYFHKDFGYAVFTVVDGLVLGGEREE
jgi:hypothetical protein